VAVEARFEAPVGKQFRVAERGGSRAVERRVFVPVLETERVNSRSPAREAVEISRRNYDFTCRHYDATARAYIFQAEPRPANKYLFRGKVWVNAEDFGIQRIEGEPAQRPSFWVRHTSFVHRQVWELLVPGSQPHRSRIAVVWALEHGYRLLRLSVGAARRARLRLAGSGGPAIASERPARPGLLALEAALAPQSAYCQFFDLLHGFR
jgi:hypothetical protein